MANRSDRSARTRESALHKTWIASKEGRLTDYHAERAAFVDTLADQSRDVFELLELLYLVSVEFGEGMYKLHHAKADQEQNHKVLAAERLYAKGCTTYSEISWLLRGGFVPGALAAWRRLEETTVILLFLADRDQLVSERYWLHDHIEQWKHLNTCQEHAKRYPSFRFSMPKEMAEAKAERDRLCQRFGTAYKDHYGWAASPSDNKGSSFRDIEERAKLHYLRPMYALASYEVHSASTAVQRPFGQHPLDDGIMAGPSGEMKGLRQVAGLTAMLMSLLVKGFASYFKGVETHRMATAVDELTDTIVRACRSAAPGDADAK